MIGGVFDGIDRANLRTIYRVQTKEEKKAAKEAFNGAVFGLSVFFLSEKRQQNVSSGL
jgi:hypothetical protein